MVRVAGLYGQLAAGVVQRSQDGLTPAQQLTEINRFAADVVSDQQACWTALKDELAAAGIVIVEPKELLPAEKTWLEQQFLARHLPVLTPIAVDPAHPFPFIQNRALTVGVELRRERDGKTMHALLPIPSQLERFIKLPSAETGADAAPPTARYIRIEFGDRHVRHQAVPRLPGAQPGRLSRPARQRHRGAGGGGGSRRPLRDGVEAPPPRPRDPAGDRREDAVKAQELRGAGARHPRRGRVHQGGHAGVGRHLPAHRLRPVGSAVQALHHPLPRAHPRVQRRLLRGDPQEGHHRPSPLRVLRRGRAAAAGRRWPIPTSWPSSGRSTARPRTARSCGR